jgi:hypothetical protein
MSYPAPAFAPISAPSDTSFSFSDASGDTPAPESSSMSLFVRAALIILLLALIGFNVFTYLDDITEWLSETFGAPFRQVARFLGYAALDTAQTTIDVSAKGTKSAVDIAAGAATSGIDVLQQTIEQKQGQPDQDQDQDQNQDQNNQNQRQQRQKPRTKFAYQMSSSDGLQKALSHAKKQPPQPDDATSRTQRAGKSGYCYIGEDRGFRSCIKVGEEDTCMSGDIFPTHAICVNPRLRQ